MTGLAPVQVEIDKKMMMGCLSSFLDPTEYNILRRQNAIKHSYLHIWVTHVKLILALYGLPSLDDQLELPPGKSKWMIAVCRHWQEKIGLVSFT